MEYNSEKLNINYRGQQLSVTPASDGTNTFFIARVAGEEITFAIAYIDGNSFWVENGGDATQRAKEIGRLIEEADGR